MALSPLDRAKLVVPIKQYARTQANFLAANGKHDLALELYEHSDIDPVALAQRGIRLHDLYYGEAGQRLQYDIEHLPVTDIPTLLAAYSQKIVSETGFNFNGVPLDGYGSDTPDELIAEIIKTAFRMAGGVLNMTGIE